MVGDVPSRMGRAYRGGDGRGRDLERDLYGTSIAGFTIALVIHSVDLLIQSLDPSLFGRLRDLYRPRISIARTIRLLDLFGRLIAPTIGNRWFTYYFETLLLR